MQARITNLFLLRYQAHKFQNFMYFYVMQVCTRCLRIAEITFMKIKIHYFCPWKQPTCRNHFAYNGIFKSHSTIQYSIQRESFLYLDEQVNQLGVHKFYLVPKILLLENLRIRKEQLNSPIANGMLFGMYSWATSSPSNANSEQEQAIMDFPWRICLK